MLFLKYGRVLIAAIAIFILAGCGEKNYTYSNSYQGGYNSANTGAIKNSPNMHRATMKPYVVNGKKYYPTTVRVGNTYSGIASWYGKDFHGKNTSNGESYNMYGMTAAHKTLPMNTMVRVTNLRNNRSAVVRINDRGPFVRTRIIDLSYTAAQRLGVVSAGTAPVRLEVIGFSGVINKNSNEARSVNLNNFLVQIGAFRNESGAKRFASMNQNVLSNYKAIVKKYSYQGSPLYRVYLSGFQGEEEARDFISKGIFKDSFVVAN